MQSSSNNSTASRSHPRAQQTLLTIATSSQHSASHDEQKMNSLMLECIRRKPIDQLMARVRMPLELMQLNPFTGSVSIQTTDPLVSTDYGYSYLQSSLASIATSDPSVSASLFRPPFCPSLDSALLPPGDDLAAMLLNSSSHFGHIDLLVGLSSGAHISVSDLGSHNLTSTSAPSAKREPKLEPTPSHILADRLSILDEEVGLTSEQANELINSFVRTFYRYHNQEISNSLVSHYLRRATSTGSDSRKVQALALLDSMLEAFQDSLVNVPVLRLALIHASHQFANLRDLLTSKLIDSLKGTQVDDEVDDKLNQLDPHFISQALVSLAQSFSGSLKKDSTGSFHNKRELESPSDNSGYYESVQSKPKATYLYQFSEQNLFRSLDASINLLSTRYVNDPIWPDINVLLNKMIDVLKSDHYALRLGLSCALGPNDPAMILAAEEVDKDQVQSTSLSMATQFNSQLCSTFSTIISDFVSNGRMSSDSQEEIDKQNEANLRLAQDLAEYRSRCYNQSKLNQDHDTTSKLIAEHKFCNAKMAELALDLINHEFVRHSSPISTEDSSQTSVQQADTQTWTIFNQLSRKIATLPSGKTIWTMGQITDNPEELDQRSSFAARSSFWLNFLPALNCSRTLPINSGIANSGLTQYFGASSPLLNLNLVFHCQAGAQTSYDIIESHVISVRQNVLSWLRNRHRNSTRMLATYRSNSFTSDRPSNNHSTRMVNNNLSNYENISIQADLQNSSIKPQIESDGRLSDHQVQFQNYKQSHSDSKPNGFLLAIGCFLGLCSLLSLFLLARRRRSSKRSKCIRNQSKVGPENHQNYQEELTPSLNGESSRQNYIAPVSSPKLSFVDQSNSIIANHQNPSTISIDPVEGIMGHQPLMMHNLDQQPRINRSSSAQVLVGDISWPHGENQVSEFQTGRMHKVHLCPNHSLYGSHASTNFLDANSLLMPVWTEDTNVEQQTYGSRTRTLDTNRHSRRKSSGPKKESIGLPEVNAHKCSTLADPSCQSFLNTHQPNSTSSTSTASLKKRVKIDDQPRRIDDTRYASPGFEEAPRPASHLTLHSEQQNLDFCPAHSSQSSQSMFDSGNQLLLNGQIYTLSSDSTHRINHQGINDNIHANSSELELWSDLGQGHANNVKARISQADAETILTRQKEFMDNEFILLQPAIDDNRFVNENNQLTLSGSNFNKRP